MDFIKEDIVISGIGGAFPKAKNAEELKVRLLNNENLLDARWNEGERGVSNQIGKVPVDVFDNAFFGIHRQQSFYMDPMQRLVLERAFEALVDSGTNLNEIKGRRIGVYMGSSVGENDNLFLESVVSGFGITGHSRAMMPNRVSYWLNLKGPSVAYDSNWVSGIEVIRLAYDAIRTGECEAAIVGTSNLALNCEMQWIYDDMGLLSREGRTKAFDADAEGYTRSDGCVVLFIQKASKARRSYASIVHVDTCFNAPPVGDILQPSADCMTEFLTKFYENSKIKAEEVDFVEAYGCGLKYTDKCEVEALDNIYCKNRKNPLLIGSIKTNTGHSEASASLFSVVKVLLAMEAGVIPANLHFNKPNPELTAIVEGRIKVVTENQKWNGVYAAVNAIGLDSYYGHVLLKANPKKPAPLKDDLPRLVLISTRTEDGIKEIMETLKSKPKDAPEYYRLLHDVFSKPILGHLYRGYALLGGKEETFVTEYHMGNKRQIWFVYSGMGSQWLGMIGDFLKIPVFANAINKCSAILKTKGVDLMDIITSKDPQTFDNILNSFVGIAAIQIGLTDVLHSIGVVPDGIIGHSVGELGCAYADGCVTAEQMILAAYSRGRASIEVDLVKGMMAAVGLGYNQIKHKLPPTIEVACHNGPDSSTISGPTEDMEKFVKELQAEGIFARLVNVSNIAYHSRYIKPAAPLLLKYLKEVIPTPVPRSSKWISTSNLEENWENEIAKTSSPEYHTNNLLSSVLFEEGLKHIPKDSILIEIAPHGLLQAILKRSLKSGCTNIALTQKGCASSVEFLLTSLGKMYLAGMDLSISSLYPPIEYPVGKGTPGLADVVHWNHTESWRTGLEGKQIHNMFGLKDMQVTLNSEEFRHCVGHQFDDEIILPISSYLNIVYDIYSNVHVGHKQIVFENIYVKNILQVPKIGSVPLYVMVQKGSGNFEFVSNNEFLMSGKISLPNDTDNFFVEPAEVEINEFNVQLTANDIYNEFQHRGYKYSGPFKSLKEMIICEEGSVCKLQYNQKWYLALDGMIQQALIRAGERKQDGQTVKTIQKIAISQSLLPEEKQDIIVNHEYSTNVISSEGIQVIGLKTYPFNIQQKSNSFDFYDLVPLNNASYSSIENGINVALQLTLKNFADKFASTNISVFEFESENPLLNNINKVLQQFSNVNSSVETVKDIESVIIQDNQPLLIVSNDFINKDLVRLVETTTAFLLVKTNKVILTYEGIVQVAQFFVDNVSYSILRKVKNQKPPMILAKTDNLTAKDLTKSSAIWIKELTSILSDPKFRNQSVYLAASTVPVEGFNQFIYELNNLKNSENLRILFNFDKKLDELKTDQIMQLIFKQDLNFIVIKNGVIGTYLAVSSGLKEPGTNLYTTNNIIPNTVVDYIAVNVRDETIGAKLLKKNEVGNIDYVGVDNSGNRVAGLATINQDTWKIIPDSILKWDVPENWTTEDACTIPHAYICAYYILFVKGEIEAGETVIIHAGCSAIGLAAISVANFYNCKIYTTVSSDKQRAFLKRQFTFLNDYSIFNNDSTNFAPLIRASTGGRGAQVIVNCLSGNRLQASVDCLADYGRFIQIGKYDLEENNSIGMSVFLKNTSFIVVNLENIFNLPREVKEELRKYILEGMDTSAVRPLHQIIVKHQNVEEILNDLKKPDHIGKILIKIDNSVTLNKLNVYKPIQHICETKGSYLIYGGIAENWLDVAEWLILRGARKIVVSSESKPTQTYINRRLSLLQSYYEAEIIFAPSKINTRESAVELLSEVSVLGPIQAVFTLLNYKNGSNRNADLKSIQFIDIALRTVAQKASLINFNSSAAGICFLRSESGYNTHNIQWVDELEFFDALNALDEVLSYNVKNVLVKTDKVTDRKEESIQSLYKKLNLMLPQSAEVICRLTIDAPNEPELVQMVTLGPKDFRELIPMFIIPGLNGQTQMEDFAKELLYPTFCTVLPGGHIPLEELAAIYAEKIRKLWPKGPYNLTGISTGGVLAIEIARQLRKVKPDVITHMHFIDSAPVTVQSVLKNLGDNQSNIELNILLRTLGIKEDEIVQKLKATTKWEDRLKIAIENLKLTNTYKKYLETGLVTLKQRVLEILLYQPNEELLTGKIYLVRPSESSQYDNCGLTTYCKTTPQVHLVAGDHLSILNKRDTTDFINEIFNLI